MVTKRFAKVLLCLYGTKKAEEKQTFFSSIWALFVCVAHESNSFSLPTQKICQVH